MENKIFCFYKQILKLNTLISLVIIQMIDDLTIKNSLSFIHIIKKIIYTDKLFKNTTCIL